MASSRARPQPTSWRLLAEDFTEAATSPDPETCRNLDGVELRAAKLFAACIEAGIAPPGYPVTQAQQSLRGRLVDSEAERGWAPATTTEAWTGPALWLGPEPPARFEPLGPHFVAAALWSELALVWLPERYPDHFRNPTPPRNHPYTRFASFEESHRQERIAEALQERARHCAEAAILMADLCRAGVGGANCTALSMTRTQARLKAEAIVKAEGWTIVRKKPSMRGMAARIGCSYSMMKKATEESPKLRSAFAAAGGSLPTPTDADGTDPEITALIAEQEQDARSDWA